MRWVAGGQVYSLGQPWKAGAEPGTGGSPHVLGKLSGRLASETPFNLAPEWIECSRLLPRRGRAAGCTLTARPRGPQPPPPQAFTAEPRS